MAESAKVVLRLLPSVERNPEGGAQPQIRRIELSGQVQGVGFRPFVYRLANELGLHGEVQNRLGTVDIIVSGRAETLAEFERALITQAPPLAKPVITRAEECEQHYFDDFRILASSSGEAARIFVPTDYFLCADCAEEQSNPDDRRFRYPFINCTQCGPRYTLIESLPYDRPNTSMSGFALCSDCLAEYTDPNDRRFHAEPIACAVCGPQLLFENSERDVTQERGAALTAAVSLLREGKVIAVKGIGGYHLMCDAENASAVASLRRRKQRPDKPLAILMPLAGDDGLDIVRQHVHLDAAEQDLLLSAARPIVVATRRSSSSLAWNIAPRLNEFGVFLPYSPLHQLLLDDFGAPLIATSGNISGEPVLTDNEEAASRLATIADAFLHHDRPIVRPADDSVYRRSAGKPRPLRLGRGVTPLEMTMPWRIPKPVIAVGGHMKATIALGWEDRVVVSPHIGEMESPRSLRVFEQLISNLQELYDVDAAHILCDAHPGYASHRWAHRHDKLPYSSVWHHRAHAAALVAETGQRGPWLVFTWDGVGYGEDGSLWGGEALLGDVGLWNRVASLRPFRLPGGDRAGREPWRSAASVSWELGLDYPVRQCDTALVRQAWQKHVNCPTTSAAGRLFDAAAAIVCGIESVSFEAHGPMLLEALARRAGTSVPLRLYRDRDGLLRSDWAPLIDMLYNTKRSKASRAADFHTSMAQLLVDQACALREQHEIKRVGLTGGVFQNRLLAEQATTLLQRAGFDVHLNSVLPCNDGALCVGQLADWSRQLAALGPN